MTQQVLQCEKNVRKWVRNARIIIKITTYEDRKPQKTEAEKQSKQWFAIVNRRLKP